MAIVVEGLSFIYMKGSPFEKAALRDINLIIKPGEFVGIIGHTGSGKSTLVQHLNGLLKPTSGKVYINDIDITSKSLKELRKQVGIVFQYPEHQLFEETVYKDIAFGLLKYGMDEKDIKTQVIHALHSVGLTEEILEKSPFELSGGQKRRVAIAGILAMSPNILVLDEPTAGLDPKGRDEIFEFISELHRKQGITIVLVSHSMEDIARLVNRLIVMSKGEILMDGPPEEVYRQIDKLESIGLSAPQITYFMKDLKKNIPSIDENQFTIHSAKDEILRILRGKRKGS